MRKVLLSAALLLVAVAPLFATPSCTANAPITPAAAPAQQAPLAPAFAAPQATPAAALIQGCIFIACMQTPTGCGCAGFFCNGHFICGIRRPT